MDQQHTLIDNLGPAIEKVVKYKSLIYILFTISNSAHANDHGS